MYTCPFAHLNAITVRYFLEEKNSVGYTPTLAPFHLRSLPRRVSLCRPSSFRNSAPRQLPQTPEGSECFRLSLMRSPPRVDASSFAKGRKSQCFHELRNATERICSEVTIGRPIGGCRCHSAGHQNRHWGRRSKLSAFVPCLGSALCAFRRVSPSSILDACLPISLIWASLRQ